MHAAPDLKCRVCCFCSKTRSFQWQRSGLSGWKFATATDTARNRARKPSANHANLPYFFGIHYTLCNYILKRIISQNKIIRSINSLPYDTHTGQFFESMNVLKVKDIHCLSMATRAFKFIGKHAFIIHSELHPFNTRNKDNPVLPLFHLTKYQKAPN